jgi:hypothetical protein
VATWLERLLTWWDQKRFNHLVMEQFDDGVGNVQTSWPSGAPLADVLAWYDTRLAKAKTPYGVKMVLVALAPKGDTTPSWCRLTYRHDPPFHGDVRDELAAELARLLPSTEVTTVVYDFGAAIHAILERHPDFELQPRKHR